MAITIQGIRVKSVSIGYDDSGVMKFSGGYELISSSGAVLAKQDFNGYNDIKVVANAELAGKINNALDGIKAELLKTIGLE